MSCVRFAHLTDLHLPILTPPSGADLLSKRLLGYLSWKRNRSRRHALWALEALAEDCRRQKHDLDVISGDLVNISLASEFIAARKWLEERFNSERTIFSPGNHDAYVRVAWAEGLGQFAPFMGGGRSDEAGIRPPATAGDFPYVRTVGDAAFIVLNSSPPTAPGLATGKIGATQLSRLRRELESAGRQGRARILVLHHPVVEGAVARRKALDDGVALRSLLAEAGVDLVLHGHAHLPLWGSVETPDGPKPVVGGGSASHAFARGAYRPARYNLFSLSRVGAGWRIDVKVRELDPQTREVNTVEERRLL